MSLLHREPDHGGHRGRALLYQRALDPPTWQRFAMAGVVLGLAGCLKYTGLYVVAVVMLSWIILRRQNRGHGIMVAAAQGVICRPGCLVHMVGAYLPFSDGTPIASRSGYSVFWRYGNVSGCVDSSSIPAVSRLHSQFPDSARGDDHRGPLLVQVLPATGLGTRTAPGAFVQLGGNGDGHLRPVQSALSAVLRTCARSLVSPRLD